MRERQRYRKERRDVLRVDKEQRLRETERDEERHRERERTRNGVSGSSTAGARECRR